MVNSLPGLTTAVIVVLILKGVLIIIPGMEVFGLLLFSLLGGCLLKNLIPKNKRSVLDLGMSYCGKSLLAIAIALLGLKIEINNVKSLGLDLLLLVLVIIAISLFTSLLFSKVFKTSQITSMLVAIGSGICGSSAIASASNLLKEKCKNSISVETGQALGAINIVGVLFLFVIPILNVAIGLPSITQAALIGGSLQSVGHVAAAGSGFSAEVFETAMLIKMSRVFFLLPLLFFISLYQIDKVSSVKQEKYFVKIVRNIPKYLWFFLILFLINSLIDIPISVRMITAPLTKFLLSLAMVGIGYTIYFKDLIKGGGKILTLALIIQILQVGFILCLF